VREHSSDFVFLSRRRRMAAQTRSFKCYADGCYKQFYSSVDLSLHQGDVGHYECAKCGCGHQFFSSSTEHQAPCSGEKKSSSLSSSIWADDDDISYASSSGSRRMEGFGNTDYHYSLDDDGIPSSHYLMALSGRSMRSNLGVQTGHGADSSLSSSMSSSSSISGGNRALPLSRSLFHATPANKRRKGSAARRLLQQQHRVRFGAGSQAHDA